MSVITKERLLESHLFQTGSRVNIDWQSTLRTGTVLSFWLRTDSFTGQKAPGYQILLDDGMIIWGAEEKLCKNTPDEPLDELPLPRSYDFGDVHPGDVLFLNMFYWRDLAVRVYTVGRLTKKIHLYIKDTNGNVWITSVPPRTILGFLEKRDS